MEKPLAALVGSPWRLPVRTIGWTLGVIAIAVFAQDTRRAFIYFQF